MKSILFTAGASLAVLGLLAACSPAANTAASSDSTAASDSVADATTVPAAADATAPAEEDSVASSAASVVVETTQIYDPQVIHTIAARPGYWQIARMDPDSHKRVVTKVCVDKDLGGRMAGYDPKGPAGPRPDASFLGACPGGVHGGDVVRAGQHTVNAWGDHRDDHGKPAGADNGHDGNGPGHDDHTGDHQAASSSAGQDTHDHMPQDNTPHGDGGAPGRPDNHMGDGHHDEASSSHSRDHSSH